VNAKSPFLIVLLALALVLAYVAFQPALPEMTVFSVSQIMIEPEGYLEGNQLKGTFWSITLVTDFVEGSYFTSWDFDDEQAHSSKSDPTWGGENMTVDNVIEIMVIPSQPYYSRKLTLASSRITPVAYQNYHAAFRVRQRQTS